MKIKEPTPRRGLTAAVTLLAGNQLVGFDRALAKGKKKKKCKKRCIAPQAKCTNKCHNCCPDPLGNPRVCALVPVCPKSADGKYCCGKEGVECSQDCDCCGDLVCPSGACCVSFGTACTGETSCCGCCEGGFCCSNAGGECEDTDDCRGALTCVDAVPGVTLGSCQEE